MNTHSLCPHCHRHLEAELFEQAGTIRLRRTCPEHGDQEAVVENDATFFQRIQSGRGRFAEQQNVVVLDVTDKCNLTCPHCYHVPDNGAPNKPVEAVLADMALTPPDFGVILGGAEPTVRRDLAELATEIARHNRPVGLLSNGVRFPDAELTRRLAPLLNGFVLIGLNHRDYHGEAIHARQLAGLEHLRANGVRPMLGYTAEYAQLPDILHEALQLFRAGSIALVRLRFGANIGRHPDQPARTLSDHISTLVRVCHEQRLEFQLLAEADNTLYHQMALIDGMPVRIIQWPDADSIVMSELGRAPWARFNAGPISNFCHQIILRDGVVHRGLPERDDLPERYTLDHWLRQRTAAATPAAAVTAAPGHDNARHVEQWSGVTVANLHGRMTPAQREALVRFWRDNGAITDEREAWRRTDEVVHLGFDADGQIVAVNTCFVGQLDAGDGPQPYWFYRIFVHPRARSVRLSLGLFRLTAAYFGQQFREHGGPRGIAMHLENPKFYNRSGRRALGWVGIRPLGRDARGVEIWAYPF